MFLINTLIIINISKILHVHKLQRAALLLRFMLQVKLGIAVQNRSMNLPILLTDTKMINTNDK